MVSHRSRTFKEEKKEGVKYTGRHLCSQPKRLTLIIPLSHSIERKRKKKSLKILTAWMIREELSINIQCIDTLLDELPGNTYEPYICNPLFFVAGLFLSLLSLGVLIFFLIFNITNQKKEQLYFFFFLIYFQHERCDFIFISVLTHFFFFFFWFLSSNINIYLEIQGRGSVSPSPCSIMNAQKIIFFKCFDAFSGVTA